ncbi:hypothetical protein [Actinomadura madurae]|nr:hypothetical protein [Actinomadura madurae]MCP9950573.1 hypothetical protein [Actinomadura madurae]MCQ0008660.1 hypothetical protein [Actinomadura madurae]
MSRNGESGVHMAANGREIRGSERSGHMTRSSGRGSMTRQSANVAVRP